MVPENIIKSLTQFLSPVKMKKELLNAIHIRIGDEAEMPQSIYSIFAEYEKLYNQAEAKRSIFTREKEGFVALLKELAQAEEKLNRIKDFYQDVLPPKNAKDKLIKEIYANRPLELHPKELPEELKEHFSNFEKLYLAAEYAITYNSDHLIEAVQKVKPFYNELVCIHANQVGKMGKLVTLFNQKLLTPENLKIKLLGIINEKRAEKLNDLPEELIELFQEYIQVYDKAARVIQSPQKREIRDAINDVQLKYNKIMTVGLSKYFRNHSDSIPNWLVVHSEDSQLGSITREAVENLAKEITFNHTDEDKFNESLSKLQLSNLVNEQEKFINETFVKDLYRMGLEFYGILNRDLKGTSDLLSKENIENADKALTESIIKNFNLDPKNFSSEKFELLIKNLKVFLSSMMEQGGMPFFPSKFTMENIKFRNTAFAIQPPGQSMLLSGYRYDVKEKKLVLNFRSNGEFFKFNMNPEKSHEAELIQFIEIVYHFNPMADKPELKLDHVEAGQVIIPENKNIQLWNPAPRELLVRFVLHPNEFFFDGTEENLPFYDPKIKLPAQTRESMQFEVCIQLEMFLTNRLQQLNIHIPKGSIGSLVEELSGLKKQQGYLKAQNVLDGMKKHIPSVYQYVKNHLSKDKKIQQTVEENRKEHDAQLSNDDVKQLKLLAQKFHQRFDSPEIVKNNLEKIIAQKKLPEKIQKYFNEYKIAYQKISKSADKLSLENMKQLYADIQVKYEKIYTVAIEDHYRSYIERDVNKGIFTRMLEAIGLIEKTEGSISSAAHRYHLAKNPLLLVKGAHANLYQKAFSSLDSQDAIEVMKKAAEDVDTYVETKEVLLSCVASLTPADKNDYVKFLLQQAKKDGQYYFQLEEFLEKSGKFDLHSDLYNDIKARVEAGKYLEQIAPLMNRLSKEQVKDIKNSVIAGKEAATANNAFLQQKLKMFPPAKESQTQVENKNQQESGTSSKP